MGSEEYTVSDGTGQQDIEDLTSGRKIESQATFEDISDIIIPESEVSISDITVIQTKKIFPEKSF